MEPRRATEAASNVSATRERIVERGRRRRGEGGCVGEGEAEGEVEGGGGG